MVGLSFVAVATFYLYKKSFHLRKKFDFSMHFENPANSSIDAAQVKMCRQAQLTSASHYNEIYVSTEVRLAEVVFFVDRERGITNFYYRHRNPAAVRLLKNMTLT